ncbi:MAG: hypothetical protein LBH01_05795 [Verrucomicrobiales bacterium]|jgi:hypothetical protein|nr:hypothetical protein [Verrucomicrobiales bacterium]
MAAPFDTPFDANDELGLASTCVANCRRKTRSVLYCIVSGISCLIIGDWLRPVGPFFIPLALILFFAGACFSLTALFYGVDYLFKFRRIKQGLISIISDMIFNLLWLLFVTAALCLPSIHYGSPIFPYMKDVADAKQIGLTLLVYANENNGNYPSDLNAFAKTNDPVVPKEIKRLLYQKNGKQLRWTLTPGLTTNDASNTILLQSAEKFKKGSQEYLIVYTVGNSAEAVKNPDENIVILNGKPLLRNK